MYARTYAAALGHRSRRPPSGPRAAIVLVLFVAVFLPGCASGAQEGVLRLGYFPNLTHAQPLFGIQSGLYEQKMGDTKLVTLTFNAGPSAFEALNAGSVDVIYVGPSPTLNAFDKQGNDMVRIIAGSAKGGASFILRPGVSLEDDGDLAGKRFATPQIGNTQDVALKHWMLERGHKPTDKGGEVAIVNARTSDILSMFQSGQIDGAWVPEPWATRLILEADGVVHLEESEIWENGTFITTQLVTTKAFLLSHEVEVGRLLDAHIAATNQLAQAGDAQRKTINDAIEHLTGKRLDEQTLEVALGKVEFSFDPLPVAMATLSEWSRDLGFATGPPPDLDKAFDLGPLRAAEARASAATNRTGTA